MKAGFTAEYTDGKRLDDWSVSRQSHELELSVSSLATGTVLLRDRTLGVQYRIDAEVLARSVRAVWEIVRPLEAVNG